jgi:putative membrane protein
MSVQSGPTSTTDLAMVRTRLAHERTLMAWIRTAFSMISFGFTIIKFFQYLGDSSALELQRQLRARNLGATLIFLGTVSLATATWQYWHTSGEKGSEGAARRISLVLVMAMLISVLGIVAFVSAFVRTGVF